MKHVLRRGKLKLADVKTVRVYCMENVKLEIIYYLLSSLSTLPEQTLQRYEYVLDERVLICCHRARKITNAR